MAERRFYEFGRFSLDATGRVLSCEGRPVPLAPKIADILLLLVENAGNVVEKEELLKKVWPHEFVEEGSLSRNISVLRKALGDAAEGQEFIATIPKRGYRFTRKVQEILRASPAAGKTMLAVLPFENLSERKSQEYLSDGLTEEMITQLGKLNPEQLGVIARASAMRYKTTRKNVQQIGRELRVDYILEGSVRQAKSRVRITAELIQVADQTHLWCESYDRDFSDILGLQSDVARSIAHAIKVKLIPPGRHQPSAATIAPAAYQFYLKGRYLLNTRSHRALNESIRYYEQAIQIDPACAVAYAGLADSYLTLQDDGYLRTLEATARARRAASRALDIDETLAEPHISLAHAYFHEFDWRAAEREFQRGIHLNPNNPFGHFYYSNYLAAMERFEEALTQAKCAESLDPVSLSASTNTAALLYLSGNYDESIRHSLRFLDFEPHDARAHEYLGRAYLEKQLIDQAIVAFRQAVEFARDSPRCLASLAHAYAVAGRKNQAMALLADLRRLGKKAYVCPFLLALVEVGLGHKDQAFTLLDVAYEQRSTDLPFVKINPRLAPLRADLRFHRLLQRLALAA